MKIKMPAKPAAEPTELTDDDLKGFANDTLEAQKASLKPEDFIRYVRFMFDACTDICNEANAEERKAKMAESLEDLNGESILASLDDASEKLEFLSRRQLMAAAAHLGATEADMRGKPVKDLRTLVTEQRELRAQPKATAPKTSVGPKKFRFPVRRLANQ